MYQIMWLRGIVYGTMSTCQFNRGLVRLWSKCSVEDDTDALGCVLMGGEL